MPEQQEGQIVPETSSSYGAHDRVKKGYWPEKFGDVEVTIDLDHPQAHMVRTRDEIEAERIAAKREAAEDRGELAEQLDREVAEQAERELAEQIDDVAPPPASKPPRRSR
jgi:hypothetical protein